MSGYDIKPIENFSPLRHAALVAETMGEVVSDLLAHLLSETNPYRLDLLTVGSPTTYSVTVDVEEVATGVVTNCVLTHTTDGSETVDEIYRAVVESFNAAGHPVNCTYEVRYNRDEDKYLTAVSKEGYRIISAPPVTVNLEIDVSGRVRASNGKPAAYVAGQHILEQSYPKLIVTQLPVTTVSENWRIGAVEKEVDGIVRHYPFTDTYIQCNYQVVCEAGSTTDILTSDRADSLQVLRGFVNRIQDTNARVGFYNKVQGTLNRDYTVTPTPAVHFTEYEDTSVMNFSLDIITRDVSYQGGTVRVVEMEDGSVEYQDGTQQNPVNFTITTP